MAWGNTSLWFSIPANSSCQTQQLHLLPIVNIINLLARQALNLPCNSPMAHTPIPCVTLVAPEITVGCVHIHWWPSQGNSSYRPRLSAFADASGGASLSLVIAYFDRSFVEPQEFLINAGFEAERSTANHTARSYHLHPFHAHWSLDAFRLWTSLDSNQQPQSANFLPSDQLFCLRSGLTCQHCHALPQQRQPSSVHLRETETRANSALFQAPLNWIFDKQTFPVQ